MNKEELQKYCAELIGVSSSEKELALDILKEKILEQIKKDGDALRVEGVGVFQLKIDNQNNSAELIFSPDKSVTSKSLFLRLPIKNPVNYDDSAIEDIFSISVGKPIVPIKNSVESGGDSETSFVFIKKKIEERVTEILQGSELLTGFNLWDDYAKSITKDSQKIEQKVDDEEFLRSLSEPDKKQEEEPDDFNSSLLSNDLDFYSYPDEELPNEIAVEDELFSDLETFKNIEEKESISTEEILEETEHRVDENIQDLSVSDSVDEPEKHKKDIDEKESELIQEPKQTFHDDDLFDIENSIFKNIEEHDKFDWNWGDELKEEVVQEDIPEEQSVQPVIKLKSDELEKKSTSKSKVDSDPFGTLEQTLASDEEFRSLTGEFTHVHDSQNIDEEYRITNLTKPREVPPEHKTRFTRLTSPVEEEYIEPKTEPVQKKRQIHKSFRERNSGSNIFVVSGIIIILIAIIYFAFSVGEIPTSEDLTPSKQFSQSETEGEVISRETAVSTPIIENQDTRTAGSPPVVRSQDNTSEVEEIRISNLIFRRGNEFNVQISSWRSAIKADEEMKRLKARGYKAFVVQAYLPAKGGTWHRVRIGGFKSVDEARNFLNNTQL